MWALGSVTIGPEPTPRRLTTGAGRWFKELRSGTLLRRSSSRRNYEPRMDLFLFTDLGWSWVSSRSVDRGVSVIDVNSMLVIVV